MLSNFIAVNVFMTNQLYMGSSGDFPYPHEAEPDSHNHFKGLLSLWPLNRNKMVRMWSQFCGDAKPNLSM